VRIDYIDSYCERVAPGFWGEPLNSASNLAFLVAAVALWSMTRGDRPAIRALPILIGLIFLGSAAFHTTATRWGAAADSGFIAAFMLYYVVLYTHLFWGVPWRRAWLAAPAFAAFTVVLAVTVGGQSMYVAALTVLIGLTIAMLVTGRPDWSWFAAASLVFAVSLTFRTIDGAVCDALPIGTHFMWHLLNATTLYLVSRAATIRARAEVSVP
jgi:hypothetical protein